MTKAELIRMKNNDGATLKKHQRITYKTGYQVATEGIETTSADVAIEAINNYGGNCGIWKSEGVYYIDKSRRVKTKKEALTIGRNCNQQSVLNWKTMGLVWC